MMTRKESTQGADNASAEDATTINMLPSTPADAWAAVRWRSGWSGWSHAAGDQSAPTNTPPPTLTVTATQASERFQRWQQYQETDEGRQYHAGTPYPPDWF